MDLTKVQYVGKSSVVPVPFKVRKKLIVGGNPVNVSNVLQPFLLLKAFKETGSHTVEVNFLKVNHVGKPFISPLYLEDRKELILEKNSVNAKKVLEPLLHSQVFKVTCSRTLGMHVLNVRYVGKTLLIPVYLEHIRERILGRRPMNVNSMENPL